MNTYTNYKAGFLALKSRFNKDDVLMVLTDLYKEYHFDYSFVDEILLDIAKDIKDWDSFIHLLDHFHGCVHGGTMFSFRYKCKAFYIKHLDDIDELIEEWEEEDTCSVKDLYRNIKNLDNVYIRCWFTYETIVNQLVEIIEELEEQSELVA